MIIKIKKININKEICDLDVNDFKEDKLKSLLDVFIIISCNLLLSIILLLISFPEKLKQCFKCYKCFKCFKSIFEKCCKKKINLILYHLIQ